MPIIHDFSPNDKEGAEKFETCKFRSQNKIVKISCCSSKNIEGYRCVKLDIFPLSYQIHCHVCKEYST